MISLQKFLFFSLTLKNSNFHFIFEMCYVYLYSARMRGFILYYLIFFFFHMMPGASTILYRRKRRSTPFGGKSFFPVGRQIQLPLWLPSRTHTPKTLSSPALQINPTIKAPSPPHRFLFSLRTQIQKSVSWFFFCLKNFFSFRWWFLCVVVWHERLVVNCCADLVKFGPRFFFILFFVINFVIGQEYQSYTCGTSLCETPVQKNLRRYVCKILFDVPKRPTFLYFILFFNIRVIQPYSICKIICTPPYYIQLT